MAAFWNFIGLSELDGFSRLAAILGELCDYDRHIAAIIAGPLMLAGVLFGCWLTRWIFRGGMLRTPFRGQF